MEEKAKQQLENLRKQQSDLAAEQRNYQTQLADLQGRMRDVGQMLSAVHGGIVTLERLLDEAPSEQPVEQPVG